MFSNWTRKLGFGWRKWREDLAVELSETFALDGEEYIRQTGDDCWREMFKDGLSPAEAAEEEAWAAATMAG